MTLHWLAGLWPWALLVVAIYCLAQIVRDIRARRYPMAIAGAICITMLGLTPIQSRVVKMDVQTRP